MSDDDDIDIENQNQNNQNENDDIDRPYTKKEKFILTLIISCGIFCQPFYLLIYFLYFMMECCKRFNFCFFYIE